MYTWPMRRLRNRLAFAACFSLLSLQLSGLHVHTGDSGFVGAPETPFTHRHGHHDHGNARHDDHGDASPAHDYEDAKDVSLLDLALGTFKMPLAIPALFLLSASLPGFGKRVRTEYAYRVLSGRHTRWRPPLRAPPQPA